jgi:hypothetical protein
VPAHDDLALKAAASALERPRPVLNGARSFFCHQRPDTLTGDLAAPGIYLRNNWQQGGHPSLVSRYRFVFTIPIERED